MILRNETGCRAPEGDGARTRSPHGSPNPASPHRLATAFWAAPLGPTSRPSSTTEAARSDVAGRRIPGRQARANGACANPARESSVRSSDRTGLVRPTRPGARQTRIASRSEFPGCTALERIPSYRRFGTRTPGCPSTAKNWGAVRIETIPGDRQAGDCAVPRTVRRAANWAHARRSRTGLTRRDAAFAGTRRSAHRGGGDRIDRDRRADRDEFGVRHRTGGSSAPCDRSGIPARDLATNLRARSPFRERAAGARLDLSPGYVTPPDREDTASNSPATPAIQIGRRVRTTRGCDRPAPRALRRYAGRRRFATVATETTSSIPETDPRRDSAKKPAGTAGSVGDFGARFRFPRPACPRRVRPPPGSGRTSPDRPAPPGKESRSPRAQAGSTKNFPAPRSS